MPRRETPPLTVLAALAMLWLCAGVALAIDIPEHCRAKNIGPQCAYANLCTLGRLHSIPALESLAPRREARPAAYDESIREQLLDLNLVWRGHDTGSFNRRLLPLANSRGVMVSMRKGAPWLHGRSLQFNHSIILTRYDSDSVSFYDPDNPERIWRGSRDWFGLHWMGNSLVFDPQD